MWEITEAHCGQASLPSKVAGTSDLNLMDLTLSAEMVHKGSTIVPIIFFISEIFIPLNLSFPPAVQVASGWLLTCSIKELSTSLSF